jgi:hypothetical protein
MGRFDLDNFRLAVSMRLPFGTVEFKIGSPLATRGVDIDQRPARLEELEQWNKWRAGCGWMIAEDDRSG